MDLKHIEDQHVVARYLADQLSDADREAFEAYCAEHPEMYRELEVAARFKVGLARLEEDRELEAVLAKKPGPMAFTLRHAAVIGGLAIGLVVLGGGVYALRVPAMGATVAEVSGRFGNTLPVAAEYELLRMRESGEVDQRMSLPEQESAIHLRVLPDVEGAASYRATLFRVAEGGEKEIADSGGLRADDRQFVNVFVSSKKLSPGLYSLLVTPEDPVAAQSTTAFRIEVKAP
jgi:hypothetical protein